MKINPKRHLCFPDPKFPSIIEKLKDALGPDTCNAYSSVTGCEKRLRSHKPCQKVAGELLMGSEEPGRNVEFYGEV